MRYAKKLYDAIAKRCGEDPTLLTALGDEVSEAMSEFAVWAGRQHSFMYTGEIKLPYGSDIELVELKSDLDDLLKAMITEHPPVTVYGTIEIVLTEKRDDSDKSIEVGNVAA